MAGARTRSDMQPPLRRIDGGTDAVVEQCIARLAREATLEINVHDLKHLSVAAALLPGGTKIFVTFLPGQSWHETEIACRTLAECGFVAVPHIPVRLFESAAMLEDVFERLIRPDVADEVLLISGDYASAQGPYRCVEDALGTGIMARFPLKRICFAGHPEGHPTVALDEIRSAERTKVLAAISAGLEVSLVTQFFFEAEPFLQWTNQLRRAGVQARIVAGLAGPARLSTLLKLALRCGVGPSIRALGARPTAFTKLLGDHAPQDILRDLAEARSTDAARFDGLHVFCFGGFIRTCEWLHRIAEGRF